MVIILIAAFALIALVSFGIFMAFTYGAYRGLKSAPPITTKELIE
jgi:uncharacterized protein YneF (UPF0154 family)